jgi:hypothetical protein
MPGNFFDVFVVGSSDPSAAGETRLAASLSAKHGVPLATVAKAISAKNLRAGQNLEQTQAQALVKQLQAMGAVTVIRAAAGRAPSPSPSGAAARAPSVQPAPMAPLGMPAAKVATPSPGSGWPGAPSAGSTPAPANSGAQPQPGFGMPSLRTSTAGDQFAQLGAPLQPAAPAAGTHDPFAPKRGSTPVLGTPARAARPSPSPTPSPASHQAQPSSSGLALDVRTNPKLDLDRSDRSGSEEEMQPVRPRPSTSASSLREMDAGGASGVAMDEDPRNLNLVRCVQHGLYYDKTKASGCRKCLSSAREVANKMTMEATPFHMGNLRRKPTQRAFLGLLFALVLGFLPAAYYCFGPGTTEVRRLRVEQELLSRQPGTEEIVRRFDELDGQVGETHDRSTRNTAIVWVAVASVAMLGWYKIT